MTVRDTVTYWQDVQKGKRAAKNMHLAICTPARNCEKNIVRNIQRIQKLEKYFAEVRLYVLENDSTDNTRAVLEKYAKRMKHCKIYDASICKEAYAHFFDDDSSLVDEIMQSNDRLLSEGRMQRMALLRDGLRYAIQTLSLIHI